MVRSFGIAEQDVGSYSGWVASSFALGQFLGSFWWGRISDKIGIRPVMLFGLFCTAASTAVFGFASNLWTAISIRFIAGILNGNIGVVKTFIGLITDETNEAQAFGVLALCWGGGGIIGPFLGGMLSEPASKVLTGISTHRV